MIIGLLLLVGVSVLAVRVFKGVAKMVETASRRNPHLLEAPKYEALLGQNLIGAGFHVEVGTRRYICTSAHQFDGAKPEQMGSLDFDEPIVLKNVVHKQADLLLITYESKKLDEQRPLKYDYGARVEVGLPVYLYPMNGGPVKGHITLLNLSKSEATVHATVPFEAAGMSGSPVVSGETGSVIGILTDANDPKRATQIGIQILRPSNDLSK
ncbi:MAG: serine protease [Chthoniobacter sp.]|nr:serine protease [Chthoniobacter sp.]